MVAVDKDGSETMFTDKPCRAFDDIEYYFYWDTTSGVFIPIPKGTIRKLIGRNLSWEDEPVKLK